MRLRVRIVSLVAVTILAGCAAALFLSRVQKEEGPPQDELSLPHFWVTTVNGGDFGIREWRYDGDLLTGTGRRSFTTVFLGSCELSTRLPALAVVGFVAAGLAGVAWFATAVLTCPTRSLHSTPR